MAQRRRRRVVHEWYPVGTKLTGRIRGEVVNAEIVAASNKVGKAVKFNDRIYESMSAAASAATRNSVDGWLFWKVSKE